MKLKKKTMMVLSFAVGTLLFATTALAEVSAKDGYDQFKDALKYSAESLSSKLSSYTMDTSFVMKDNGKAVSSGNSISKYDTSKGARVISSTTTNYDVKTEYYNYMDKNTNIFFNSGENIYYVNEGKQPIETQMFKDPFKEKTAGDLEKIADALVGSLKDYVVVNVKPDGSKELSGSLSESQIPALVNAVTSFEFKSSVGGNNAMVGKSSVGGNNAMVGGSNINELPAIINDIFVKDVKGTAVVDKNGLLQSILATGTLSGKDSKGTEHTVTFELLSKLSDINSTVVNKPDLTGKKVEKSEKAADVNNPNPKYYSGQYKGNIIIFKDGKAVKIGEAIVDIERSDDKTIAGRYHEEYRKGYEEYASNRKDFKFEASFNKDPYNSNFNVTDSSGKSLQCSASLFPYGARLYFNINEPQRGNRINDGELNKVFD